MTKTAVCALLVSLFTTLGQAAAPAGWLNTPDAQAFAQRVIDLALLYNEGSGLDPEGFKIDTRLTGQQMLGCPVVEVVVSLDGMEVGRESVPACKPTHGGHK